MDPTAGEATAKEKPHLYVVDDNESMLKNLEIFFSRQYEMTTSLTGDDALEVLKSKKIDLVILDLNLGVKSGETVLAEIKKAYPKQKVVMFTGETLGPFENTLLRMGALCVVPKDIELLQKVIEKALVYDEEEEAKEASSTS